ncbi:MAG TPA: molybdopterin molybdotransferase MoeA [Mycobacteriales bacterium]|nr:molybdopterin molybdotransferase MoeA [Mycobacteriales bacterium]
MIEWAAARRLAHATPDPLPAHAVAVADALGTTLAAPLLAGSDIPAYTSSAMDGYAVAGPGPWRLVGALSAGSPDAERLQAGTAVAIATGAALPDGADAVLPVEDAIREPGRVGGTVAPGRHIRRAGEAFTAGTILAPVGTPVGPVLLGLAAGAAVDGLSVHGPVTVECILTGREVIAGGRPDRGRVRDAVGPMLVGLVPGLGARSAGFTRVGDGRDELAAALSATRSDVVVTCGSTSVGRSDVLRAVLQEAGAELIVDGVNCRPGHPQLLARLPGNRWLVGLPGNPAAALVAALTLLGPLVLGLLNRPLPELERALLAAPEHAGRDRTRLVSVCAGGPGRFVPIGHDGPVSLWGASRAGWLAVVPSRWDGREPVALLAIP